MDVLRRLVQSLPPKLLPFARRVDRLNRWIAKFCYLLVMLMIGLGVWNVIGRFLGRLLGMNLTSNSLIEGQWYLFSLLFLLGGAYTLFRDGHVRVDIFYNQWNDRQKAIANLLGTIVFLIPFCIVIFLSSWSEVFNSWSTWEISPDPGGLPRYPLKTMILVSVVLLMLQGIAEIIKNWAFLTGHTDTSPQR
ncbi:TRAP transporter small permease subunit [Romeriopsis navalis]|uniref:TRAP transporter small permease subunit n=1 Tax=Romeriopsis navalis TaxID=2992132 RepID=UPI0021F8C2ED|nr:TRAP transporter small permease subunit [Romeriopsis navalis]